MPPELNQSLKERAPTGLIEWYLDLKRLHDLCVPAPCWINRTKYREGAWAGFLPACLLDDPPEERLIVFVEFPFGEEAARAATGGGFPTRETLIEGGLQQFGSPNTYVEDAQELEVALENRFATVWALLWDFSWESRGLDLNELFEAAIATRED